MATSEQKPPGFEAFEDKMRRAHVGDATIRAFQHSYRHLVAGGTGFVPETSIDPVLDLPHLEAIPADHQASLSLVSQTVILKLNGGLGTSMGLDRAKSLLLLRDGLTFLDFAVKQIQHLRSAVGVPPRFLLMNSFTTSRDTLEFLAKYPELGESRSLELMQSQVPKVDATSFGPVSWPANPTLEWCPPGHGDIYPSLLSSGLLERLLAEGRRYLFVSNSDNLGASLDLTLLSFFAQSGQDFIMEVAERTPSDRKGGHLARRNGRFMLRESAQCPESDLGAFQDIHRHRFFNTNNLWIRLDSMRAAIAAGGGFIPLPTIQNRKTVDPRDKNSPPVFQLETALGAAIECFPKAGAIVVPRTRFAPVKTTSDLLALRSDAYAVTPDWRVVLASGPTGTPPAIRLDPNHYQQVDQLDEKLRGVPSLRNCEELAVQGSVLFESGTVFRGKLKITNRHPTLRPLPAGDYEDCSIEL